MSDQRHRDLSNHERLDWLRLSRTERIGPVTFKNLIARFGSATEALAALPDLSRRGGRRRALTPFPKDDAERELEAHEKHGGRLVAACEASYPAPLAAVEDAPPLISLFGRPEILHRQCVALVGSRNASGNGRRLAQQLAADLGVQGFTVVSGLARGIDTAAHEGSLDSGTAAVLAGGADFVYPRENLRLYEIIKERGVIVSEIPLGTQPQARHFPRRNRLISGLCRGVLVVEAALRSGSLITARYALEQGREVFAVPGSPLDPRARGCNKLIRDGALLTETADDILETLQGALSRQIGLLEQPEPGLPDPQGGEEADSAAGQESLLTLLGPDPVMVDELIRRCQLSVATVTTALLELELAGRLERHPGNRVALVHDFGRTS